MRIRLGKHYRYALFSSLYITLSLSVLTAGFMYYYQIPLWILFFFSAFCYIICFGIIQYYTQRFIYQKIHDVYKTIYTDVSIYDEEPVTNIDLLSKEVERFSEDKRLQIEDLKLRDDFRKEFIGNLAHELKTPLLPYNPICSLCRMALSRIWRFATNILIVQLMEWTDWCIL